MVSSKALKPQFKRLNPVTGLKRIVSAKGQWEAAKAILRLIVVAVVVIPILIGVGNDLAAGGLPLGDGLAYLGGQTEAGRDFLAAARREDLFEERVAGRAVQLAAACLLQLDQALAMLLGVGGVARGLGREAQLGLAPHAT